MIRILLAAAAFALALIACLDEHGPASDHALPTAATADLGQTPDGSTGWARIQTAAGVSLLPYVARGGHAICQDDLDLGPIMNVDARLYGGTVLGATEPWPEGRVDFAFHPAFVGNARATVRAAMAALERRAGVTFVERPYGEHAGGWIELKWGPSDAWYGGMSTAIGMVGCGEPHCSVHDGCRSDCGQWIYFRGGAELAPATVEHQLQHALGQLHLTARPTAVSPLATVEDPTRRRDLASLGLAHSL